MAYQYINSPVGQLTMFEDSQAIVAIEWGRGPEPSSSPLLDEAVKQLKAYFDNRLHDFDLPLSPEGTSFQKSVWKLMNEIPFGSVRTYGDLAKDLGSSARAVGGACGCNPIPIVIPCHRIVGSGGRMTGFSGGDGLNTKGFLLRHEGDDLFQYADFKPTGEAK